MHDYDFYNIKQLDPLAKPSSIVKKSKFHNNIEGDGDVWVETILQHSITGNKRIYFVSNKTGKRSRDEPPTGASQVVYLKNSARDFRMRCTRFMI